MNCSGSISEVIMDDLFEFLRRKILGIEAISKILFNVEIPNSGIK